jgi:hypothetical protein
MSTEPTENPTPAPSTHGPDGKDGRGRFAKGNKLGKGNPLAGRAAKIRAVLLKKLTPAVAGQIADQLITAATAGDMAAVRELLDRTIGKPVPSEMAERMEALERRLDEQEAHRTNGRHK